MLSFQRREALAAARLYLVCDELADGSFARHLHGGVDIVQLRMKSADDERLVAVCRRYASTCSEFGVPLILNDRPDLVVAGGADGVHVGQEDLAVAEARALLGPDRLVGLSTHTPAQIDAAGRTECRLHRRRSRPHDPDQTWASRGRAGAGVLRGRARQDPFFAIGGINSSNIAAVAAAGARRIAVVRALTQASDPQQAALTLRTAIELEAGVGAG